MYKFFYACIFYALHQIADEDIGFSGARLIPDAVSEQTVADHKGKMSLSFCIRYVGFLNFDHFF